MIFEPLYPCTRISRGELESSTAHEVMHPETIADPGRPREGVTGRAFLLGLISIVCMCLFAENYGRGLVRTFMPVTALLVLTVWIGINILLKCTRPSVALSRTEVLTIFGLTWLVGTLPGIGMIGSLFSSIASPAYFSTPEDRFWEVAGSYFPMHLFFEQGSPVVEEYYLGVKPGGALPWQSWVKRLFWWFTGTVGMVMAGFFASVLFFRQWSEKERLNFPLSTFPAELLETSEGSRVPDVFRKPIFWVGFACSAGVIFWNVAGYFILTLPAITLYYHPMFKNIDLGRYFPPFNVRVHPLFMGLAYHCPLNILFSFWVFYALRIFKTGMMNRFGFTVGLAGQAAEPTEILMLEAHGALVFLVAWSLWVARRHLKETFRKGFLEARDDDGLPVSYRIAWLGFSCSTVFLIGWLMAAGFSLPVALLQLMLYFVMYFGMAKYTAASGFVFLQVRGRTGGPILKSILGTRGFSPRNLVGIAIGDFSGLAGGYSRPLAVPAIVHFFRLIGKALRRRPMVWGALPAALLTGYIVQCWAHMDLNYAEGAMNTGFGGIGWQMRGLISDIEATSPAVFDPQRLLVWVIGGMEAGLLSFLGSRFSGWPLHPIALAFPTGYGFSIFLIWLPKYLILRFGGVSLYRRSVPFWYGVVVGYLVGLAVSTVVDIIWFPYVRGYGTMHGVHSK